MNTNYPIKGVHEGIPFEVDLDIKFNITEYDPCLNCNGRGWVEIRHWGLDDDHDPHNPKTEKCHTCEGTGRKRWWKNDPDWWKAFPTLAREIRDAWHREWNRQQNEAFILTPSPKDLKL